MTSTTTTTTTHAPSTSRKPKRRKANSINATKLPYYRYDSEGISHSENPKPSRPRNKGNYRKHNKTSQYKQSSLPMPDEPPESSEEPHIKNEQHMCIFETLAKQNNMSTRQYYQMMKKDLSSGKTMSCDVTCDLSHLAVCCVTIISI
ncbi:hypothetical protein ACF0H5_013050 [Mactra antiquata]